MSDFQSRVAVTVSCARCGKTFDDLVLDHNHLTGRHRGLVCRSCNGLIGRFEHPLYRPDQARVTMRYLADNDNGHPLVTFYDRPGGLAPAPVDEKAA